MIVRLRQARALAALALLLLLALPWLALPCGSRAGRVLEVLAWRALLRGFGVGLRVQGIPAAPAIVTANHVSWLDIVILARTMPGGFVAKGEVGQWPVIGRLARQRGCVFIARERRSEAGGQAAAIAEALASQPRIILFPEGTTGPGTHVLPFRSALLVAGMEGTPVQPVTLRYRGPDGRPLSPADLRRVAWLDDDALWPHAMALAAMGPITAEVIFCPPLRGSCRKTMARDARAAIESELAG